MAMLAQTLCFWPTVPAFSTSTTGTNLHSKLALGAHSLHWQWQWHCCQPPLGLRQSTASHLDYRGNPAAKIHLWSNCRDIKRVMGWEIENVENSLSQNACQSFVSEVVTDGVEWELHLTSFFLFLTLGIFPSFIFLGFFFFCCLRESSSEKKLSSGVRGTVWRSPSSSSSGHRHKNIFCLVTYFSNLCTTNSSI